MKKKYPKHDFITFSPAFKYPINTNICASCGEKHNNKFIIKQNNKICLLCKDNVK